MGLKSVSFPKLSLMVILYAQKQWYLHFDFAISDNSIKKIITTIHVGGSKELSYSVISDKITMFVLHSWVLFKMY